MTASDHGTALGLNPYCTRQELWRRWNGFAAPHDEQTLARFQWGHDHAPDAVGYYESETGEIVVACLDREVFVSYEDWSGATPDGLVGDDGLIETKCPQKLWEVPPSHYYVQCQSQLAITGRQWCDLAAWTPDGSAIWRTEKDTSYWPQAKPVLKSCWESLRLPEQPKKSAKPKFTWEVKWTRIA